MPHVQKNSDTAFLYESLPILSIIPDGMTASPQSGIALYPLLCCRYVNESAKSILAGSRTK